MSCSLWNQLTQSGVYTEAVTSRWFPLIFALFQAMRHLGMIAYGYWLAEQNQMHFDVAEFIREDLARPLFEPYGFCGACYSTGQTAVLGLDFPAYAAVTLLHSAMTGGASCVDALMTPRGHILSTAFVLPLWYFVGLGIRRFGQRRWRNRAEGRARWALIALWLLPLPVGVLLLLVSVVSLFVSDLGFSVRAAGSAFRFLYPSALAAERLRVWPFNRLGSLADKN